MAERDRDTRPYLPVLSTKLWSVHMYKPRDLKVGQACQRSRRHSHYLWITTAFWVTSDYKWRPELCPSPQISYVEALHSLCSAFGNKAYKDVLTKMGPLQGILIQSDWCPYKRRLRYTEGWPCEEAARWWSSTSQGEKCQRKSTLQTPWPWTFSLQNCEKINFCCLVYPVCGIWLYSSLTRQIIILHAFSTFLVFSHHFF